MSPNQYTCRKNSLSIQLCCQTRDGDIFETSLKTVVNQNYVYRGQVAYRLRYLINRDRDNSKKPKKGPTMPSTFKVLFIVTWVFIILGCGKIPNASDAKHMETTDVVFEEILIIGQDEKRGMVFWGTMVNTGRQDARNVSYIFDFEMTGGRVFEGTWSDPIHVPPSVPIRIVGNEKIERAFLASIVWKTRWYSLDGERHEANGQITF